MAGYRSPARLVLDAYCADGLWHDRRELIAHVARYIPAGSAIRRVTRDREMERKSDGPISPRRGDDVMTGSHRIAQGMIVNACKGPEYERDGEMIRRLLPKPQ